MLCHNPSLRSLSWLDIKDSVAAYHQAKSSLMSDLAQVVLIKEFHQILRQRILDMELQVEVLIVCLHSLNFFDYYAVCKGKFKKHLRCFMGY